MKTLCLLSVSLLIVVLLSAQTIFENDIGVIEIIEPISCYDPGEQVVVRVFNFGIFPQSNFDISFSDDLGNVVYDTVVEIVYPGDFLIFTYTETVASNSIDTLVCCTHLPMDENPDNDCFEKEIQTTWCVYYSIGCTAGDGFTDFALEEIENYNSGCEDNIWTGWSQYLDFGPAVLTPGDTFNVTMATAWDNNYTSIWIDFDHDEFFLENDMVLDNFIMETSGVLYDVPLLIPSEAPPGLHFLRGRTNWNQLCLHA